jgi:hypothetical protein
MLGFGRKKGDKAPAPAGGLGVPTQKVIAFSSQGMSEPEIVKRLREEGHTPLEVDRAMKDAMRSGAGTRQPPPPVPQPPQAPVQQPWPRAQTGPAPPAQGPPEERPFARDRFAPTDWDSDDLTDDDFDVEKVPSGRRLGPDAFASSMDDKFASQAPEEPEEREPLPFAQPPLPKGRDDRVRELKDRRRREIEELAEEITEEKWQELMKRVGNLEDRLERMTADVKNAAAQAPGSAPDEVNALKKDIETQKESIEETNARIDSLEEVVKGSLAPMLDSVRKFNTMAKAPGHAAAPPQPPPAPQAAEREESSEPPRYAPKPGGK